MLRTLLAAGAGLVLVTSTATAAHAAPPSRSGTPARVQPARPVAGQPDLGPNVYVFTPDTPQAQIQSTVDAIAAQQKQNQFGRERYSLFFAPGTYGSAATPLRFDVGYYTEVAGLGAKPTDVTINGSVDVRNRCTTNPDGSPSCFALDNFWRSLSNLSINLPPVTSCETSAEFWAVSQASPMRRVSISGGNLSLMDYCGPGPQFASGGYIADSNLPFTINGSQQQFIVRNSTLAGWSNGVWNQVFAGVVGAPPQSFSETSGQPDGTPPYTTLPTTPVTQGRPFLYLDGAQYRVMLPAVQRNSVGQDWTSGTSLPLSRFYVARPSDSASKINSALSRGLNLLLTPGVYDLQKALEVKRAHTIVLGLGFATLVPQNGDAAVNVADVPDVHVAGLIVDAGPRNSKVLMEVGRHGDDHDARAHSTPGSASPTVLQDVFFRIGGAALGRATTSLVVTSSKVILDDLWAWRADHGTGVGWTQNTAGTGVVVNGDDVTAYGLFVEHYQKDEVVWNGRRGTVIFFQNEMPYDPPSQAAWNSPTTGLGYPAFVVSGSGAGFEGWGMGSYCFFNQGVDIHSATAFVVPSDGSVSMHDLLTRFLNGSGGIDHVVNDVGAPVNSANNGPSDVVTYP